MLTNWNVLKDIDKISIFIFFSSQKLVVFIPIVVIYLIKIKMFKYVSYEKFAFWKRTKTALFKAGCD